MSNTILELKDIYKSYTTAGVTLEVLKGANLNVEKGQIVAIIGESGSGKSTLLHIASLLDYTDSGDVIFEGKALKNLPDKEKSKIRNKNFGFVYQSHMLMKEFTVLENVLMPILIERKVKKKDKQKAFDLLEKLNITECAEKFPNELSGGQQQRVAIARGLIQTPKVVFADEPTGNLDPETAKIVRDLFNYIIQEEGVSLVIVSHDINLAQTCDKVYKLEEKKLVTVK